MRKELASKLLKNLEKTFSENWAHPELARIWMIIQTPDFDDGQAYLGEADIEKIGVALIEANKALNTPEIKALLERENEQ